MAFACVDIGSNTTRLLIADYREGRLHELAHERAFTRLGRDVDSGGLITQRKIAETAAVVSRHVRRAREEGVEQIAVVATAAVREAVNRASLLAAIDAATGLTAEVLSVDEEGRLAFLGATRMLEFIPPGNLAVVDVGGGSTEVVVGSVDSGVTWSRSLRIGSGSMADCYLASDPPAQDQLAAAGVRAATAFEALGIPPIATAIACGGSAGSLRRIAGTELSRGSLARALRLLAGSPSNAVSERFSLDPERARLLPAGVLILEAACNAFGLPLQIGAGGLREGLIIELAQGRW